jgi:hypothetical protein
MYNNNCKRNRALPVSISAIILVAVSTMQLSSMIVSNGNAASNVYAKYSNNQAQSLINECGIGESSGVNCAINGPQIQADGSATTPVISQTSGQRGPAGPSESEQKLQVRTVIGDSTIALPGFTTATASCAPDELATGGGIATGTVLPGSIYADMGIPRDAPNTWTLLYINPGPTSISIRAFAECAS